MNNFVMTGELLQKVITMFRPEEEYYFCEIFHDYCTTRFFERNGKLYQGEADPELWETCSYEVLMHIYDEKEEDNMDLTNLLLDNGEYAKTKYVTFAIVKRDNRVIIYN